MGRCPRFNATRTRIIEYVDDVEALLSWCQGALGTIQGEQEYLPVDFGIDIMTILSSTTPDAHLARSIQTTLRYHPDIRDITVNVQRHDDGGLTALVTIDSRYGRLTMDQYLAL